MQNRKHAYMIIAHDNFNILKKLLILLDHERNDIFLHIDKKVKNFPFEEFKNYCKKSTLIFTKRISVFWGHSSQVDCEMLLLKTAMSNNNFEYLHLLSGVDLPIKSQEFIHEFFDENPNKQFLQVGYAESQMHRISRYHFFVKYKKLKIIRRIIGVFQKLIKVNRLKNIEIPIVKTANWFSITGDCANYILSKESFITKLTRYSLCADEMFLGTVIFDSKFRDAIFNPGFSWDGHMRFIDRINNVGSSPHTFTMKDFERLISSDCLFARKFDEKIDKDIVNALYNYVSNL